MSKSRFTLSIFASLLLLSIQVPIQAQTGETRAGTATVSGRVLLKNEPAQAVAVVLQPQGPVLPTNPDAVLRARTDGSGRFQFTGVAAGRYSIMAFAPGAISSDDTRFGQRGKTLHVSDGENIENIDLAIKLGGVITGRVADSQGRPLVDEYLTLNMLGRDGKSQPYYGSRVTFEMLRTDDRGVYRIYGLPEGRYLISVGYAQAPGSVTITSSRTFYPKTYHPDVTDESQAKVIEVTEGSESTNVDITVGDAKRTYDIYGRVVNADTGQPVAGVEISRGSSRDGRIGAWGSNGERSNANGEFRLIGALPGVYAIFAAGGGSSEYISDPVNVEVNDSDVHGVEVRVRKAGSISGVVVIEGTSDPKTLSRISQINLRTFTRPVQGGAPSAPNIGMIKVNADGSFRIPGLQQGMVGIAMMSAPGLTISRIELNGVPQLGDIEIKSGEHITGMRIVVTQASLTLRGEVKLIGVVLPQGQRLFASARRTELSIQNQVSAEVDARGQFVFENLAPGEYEVRIYPIFNPDSERPDPQVMRAFSASKRNVVLSADNQPTITLVVDINQKGGNQ